MENKMELFHRDTHNGYDYVRNTYTVIDGVEYLVYKQAARDNSYTTFFALYINEEFVKKFPEHADYVDYIRTCICFGIDGTFEDYKLLRRELYPFGHSDDNYGVDMFVQYFGLLSGRRRSKFYASLAAQLRAWLETPKSERKYVMPFSKKQEVYVYRMH